MPECRFPPNLSTVFVFKLIVEFIISNDCSDRVDSLPTRASNNFIALLNVPAKLRKLLQGLFARPSQVAQSITQPIFVFAFALQTAGFRPSHSNAIVQFLFTPKKPAFTWTYSPVPSFRCFHRHDIFATLCRFLPRLQGRRFKRRWKQRCLWHQEPESEINNHPGECGENGRQHPNHAQPGRRPAQMLRQPAANPGNHSIILRTAHLHSRHPIISPTPACGPKAPEGSRTPRRFA